ncbi:predicted protein [Nematostella vectensis]|uniref:Aldehyde dehydrogenase domain-containing protein n=1 Tax=Nematostella vectensis TaxID=45351 RepID=A7RQD4_NEMVE|nr:predicted protein [Nematostella vectensis]|eukprot:XP_001638407.1 predicted protein [Nematostella vectensis]
MIVLQNFINGEFLSCDRYIDSYDPSRGEVYCKVPDSGKEHVDLAVAAANAAFKSWSVSSPAYRAERLRKLADLIEDRLEEFAQAESRDQGKTVNFARNVDIPRCCLNLRMFASAIMVGSNSRANFLESQAVVNYSLRSPKGVAGLISPWNLPLYLLSFKIAPAVASGCTVVCKPSEMTSVTAWMMAELINDAGFPPGVINIVFGTGSRTGSAIVQHPDVHLISFTGSTTIGELITKMSAPFCKKLSLEACDSLGGKNPSLVFEDADLAKWIPLMLSSFANQGEICLCTSRIFVQRSIYDNFLDMFVQETRKLIVGPPTENSSFMGALISKDHLEKVKGYIRIAKEDGGTVLCGESKDPPPDLPKEYKNGYFMRPTVITDVKDSSRCMQEEIFGPVTCVVPFDTEDEVIERANGVKYGLSACVWTENLSRAHRVSHRLQAGTVWCNCWLVRDLNMPFGGTKMSGVGREGTHESLEFFTESKTICIKM